MYRKEMKKLLNWKEDTDRKPLILNGARQVGKTWILKEFGNKYYSKTAYINMDRNPRMKELFYHIFAFFSTSFLVNITFFVTTFI